MIEIAICHRTPQENDRLTNMIADYQRENPTFTYRLSCFPIGSTLLAAVEQGREFDGIFLDAANEMPVGYLLREMGFRGFLVLLAHSAAWALEGYRVQASDYLLAPLSEAALFACLDHIPQSSVVRPFLASSDKIERIYLDQIACLESQLRRVIIHLRNGHEVSVVSKLDEVAAELDYRFLKCNRSYYINMDLVESVGVDFVMEGGFAAPIKVREKRIITTQYYDYIKEHKHIYNL